LLFGARFPRGEAMADVVLLAVTVVFFALAFAFCAWIDRI
jgi:hypothetical protein